MEISNEKRYSPQTLHSIRPSYIVHFLFLHVYQKSLTKNVIQNIECAPGNLTGQICAGSSVGGDVRARSVRRGQLQAEHVQEQAAGPPPQGQSRRPR